MTMIPALTFTVAFAALSAAHWVSDYWLQSNTQATRKGLPGWPGRRACLAHVAVYHLTAAGFLALAAGVLAVPLSIPHVTAGLAVSAVTHYFADRRTPLRRLACLLGKESYWHNGGAAQLDQAWHWAWLFAASLVIAA